MASWPGQSQELLRGARGAEHVRQGERGDAADPLGPQRDPARGWPQVSRRQNKTQYLEAPTVLTLILML